MGVAVNQARVAVRAQQRSDCIGVDVHDFDGLLSLGGFALLAQRGDEGLARGQRLSQEAGLPGRVAHLAAEGLVSEIVGAQRVAM